MPKTVRNSSKTGVKTIMECRACNGYREIVLREWGDSAAWFLAFANKEPDYESRPATRESKILRRYSCSWCMGTGQVPDDSEVFPRLSGVYGVMGEMAFAQVAPFYVPVVNKRVVHNRGFYRIETLEHPKCPDCGAEVIVNIHDEAFCENPSCSFWQNLRPH